MESGGPEPARSYERGDQALPDLSYAELSLHSGPLPHPEVLVGYGAAGADFPERIMSMAEAAHQAAIDRDMVPIRAESRALVLATVAVSFLPWVILAFALVLLVLGYETVGIVAGAAGLLAAGPQVIQATRWRPRSSESRDDR